MNIRNKETVFVVAAILILSPVISAATTTGLISTAFYPLTQSAYASKQISTEEDTDTSRKRDQQPSGALRQPTVGAQCPPDTICAVGPPRPGTEGKTEAPERDPTGGQFGLPEQQEEEPTAETQQCPPDTICATGSPELTSKEQEDLSGNADTDEQQAEGDADDLEEQAQEEIVKAAPIAV